MRRNEEQKGIKGIKYKREESKSLFTNYDFYIEWSLKALPGNFWNTTERYRIDTDTSVASVYTDNTHSKKETKEPAPFSAILKINNQTSKRLV